MLLLLAGGHVPIPTLASPWTETGNYTCEFCGKQYKYYTPYQEHVALHAPISEYLLWLGPGGVGGRGGPATGRGFARAGWMYRWAWPGAASRCPGLTRATLPQ